MFDRISHTHVRKEADIIFNGVGAPDAARLLKELESEASSRIDDVVFGRLDTGDIKLSWAVVTQFNVIKNCKQICVYYNDGSKHKRCLETIEADGNPLASEQDVLKFIADDMARKITNELICTMMRGK